MLVLILIRAFCLFEFSLCQPQCCCVFLCVFPSIWFSFFSASLPSGWHTMNGVESSPSASSEPNEAWNVHVWKIPTFLPTEPLRTLSFPSSQWLHPWTNAVNEMWNKKTQRRESRLSTMSLVIICQRAEISSRWFSQSDNFIFQLKSPAPLGPRINSSNKHNKKYYICYPYFTSNSTINDNKWVNKKQQSRQAWVGEKISSENAWQNISAKINFHNFNF